VADSGRCVWCSAMVSVCNILLDSEIYVSVLQVFDESNFLCLIKILHNIDGFIKIIKQLFCGLDIISLCF
jgi:hypothetical protein